MGLPHAGPCCAGPCGANSFPTEARLRQKEKLKRDKEAGIKPKKRKKIVEPGNDDCGDDLSGLGSDITLLSCDVIPEDIHDDSEDSDADLFITPPTPVTDNTTNIFSAVASLCYGRYNQVDLLELCGGAGRISQVAFRRGLLSGGN